MKLSFVIPAYNEEKGIGKCLEAVFEEIKRNPGLEVEVVVVNNASTDHTREEALKFPGVTVVEEKLKGLVYARRAGFVATKGELVANVDADTRLPQGWLKKVIAEFEKDKNLVALSGPYIYYDLPLWQRALVKVFYFPGWAFGRMLQGGNFVIKRDAWEKAGGFDTSISFYGEDTDVARRIAKWGRVKWTWSLYAYTSGRRLQQEGFLYMGWIYALNFLSTNFLGRPYTRNYRDVREVTSKIES